MLFHHFVLWWVVSRNHGRSLLEILSSWDSTWYTAIVRDGYDPTRAAFYPFYPAFLWLMSFGGKIHPAVAGTILSTALFLTFCFAISKCEELRPKTLLGWFFFVYSPASYVFHSNHTESTFLVLSFLTFYFCSKRQFLIAATVAGLSALTKNQGVFLSVVVGVWAALDAKAVGEKTKKFMLCGVVSAGIYALLPLFHFMDSGEAFAFLKAQSKWAHVSNVFEYFQTFWFGNVWQNTNFGSIVRHVWYFIMVTSVGLLWKANRALALYVFLFLAVMPAQGELVVGFRFASVLFPALFALGDRAEKFPKWAQILIAIGMILINHHVTRNYALHRWAY